MTIYSPSIKVLLIENDLADVKLTNYFSVKTNQKQFELIRVNQIEDGLNYLRHHYSDIVLLDLNLSNSDGLNTLRKVQTIITEIPIIVFTEEEANKELEKLSVIDELTKVANRRKFNRYIASEWQRLAREKAPLALILCDIDYFKLYNDTYGHQAGDRCLKLVAQAISKAVKRPADLVARYGGEEFAVVLPNTSIEGAEYLAQQIRLYVEALQLPHINSSVDLYITLSLGVSGCIPKHNSVFDALIAAADSGLYQAKELGRNQVVRLNIE